MAFWLFLGLVPLAALIGWALTRFAHQEVRHVLLGALSMLTPEPAVQLIDAQLTRLSESGQTVAPVSLVGFLWLASRSMHSALTAIQIVRFGHSLPWWRNRLVSLLFVGIFVITMPVSALVVTLASPAATYALQHGWIPHGWTTFLRYAALPVGLLLTVGVTGAFYRVAYPLRSSGGVKPAKIWPGAWLSTSLWAAITWFMSHHADWVARFPLFYGSLAAVALVMIWLWAGSFVLLVGFELNLQQEGVRETVLPTPPRWLKSAHQRVLERSSPIVRAVARKRDSWNQTNDSTNPNNPPAPSSTSGPPETS